MNDNILTFKEWVLDQIFMLLNICIYLKIVIVTFLQYVSTGFISAYCFGRFFLE